MADIRFTSPGAAMQSELEKYLVQQEVQRRQKMLDDLAVKREGRLNEATDAQIANTKANTDSLIAQRDAAITAREQDAFTKAHLPGDMVTPEEAKKYPGMVMPGQVKQGAHLGVDDQGVDQYEVSQTDPTFRGTPEQRLQQQQREQIRQVIQQNPELANHQGIKTALQLAEATGEYGGLYSALAQMTKPQDTEVRSAGGALFEKQADGTWKQVATGPNEDNGGRPYFMPIQTATGIVPFNTRTGVFDDTGRRDLKPGETAQKELALGQTVLSMIDRISNSMLPEKLGPIAGRYKSVEAAITGGDPDFAELAAQVAQLQNVVINLRTGAAMSEPEAKRILGEIPSVKLPPVTFMARLRNAQRYYLDWQNNRANIAYGRTTVPSSGQGGAPGGSAETPEQRRKRLYDQFSQP